MTDQFVDVNKMVPITPPPELVREWRNSSRTSDMHFCLEHIATQAAHWGADQELEACVEWLQKNFGDICDFPDKLRAARRPKPPSLKDQALEVLERSCFVNPKDGNIIRRALEALPND